MISLSKKNQETDQYVRTLWQKRRGVDLLSPTPFLIPPPLKSHIHNIHYRTNTCTCVDNINTHTRPYVYSPKGESNCRDRMAQCRAKQNWGISRSRERVQSRCRKLSSYLEIFQSDREMYSKSRDMQSRGATAGKRLPRFSRLTYRARGIER